MYHGGMCSGLLHANATRSLSGLAQIPKEDIQTLEHMLRGPCSHLMSGLIFANLITI